MRVPDECRHRIVSTTGSYHLDGRRHSRCSIDQQPPTGVMLTDPADRARGREREKERKCLCVSAEVRIGEEKNVTGCGESELYHHMRHEGL